MKYQEGLRLLIGACLLISSSCFAGKTSSKQDMPVEDIMAMSPMEAMNQVQGLNPSDISSKQQYSSSVNKQVHSLGAPPPDVMGGSMLGGITNVSSMAGGGLMSGSQKKDSSLDGNSVLKQLQQKEQESSGNKLGLTRLGRGIPYVKSSSAKVAAKIYVTVNEETSRKYYSDQPAMEAGTFSYSFSQTVAVISLKRKTEGSSSSGGDSIFDGGA